MGLGVSLSSTRAEQPYHAYTSSGALTIFESVSLRKSVGAAPFVRYYYMLGEKAGFYGQLSAGYSHERITTDNTNPNSYTYHTKSDIGYVNLTPAFVYFPTKKVGLEARLGYVGYDHSTNRTENATGLEAIKTTSSNFTATFGISSFSLGASLYLGR
nr:hypothetical protein [Solirubrum puertoriconensis]